jgi:hypothetical protein
VDEKSGAGQKQMPGASEKSRIREYAKILAAGFANIVLNLPFY